MGRDPQADQGHGIRREYDIYSAFKIYLLGMVLVRDFRMDLKEAKIHIENIFPQLQLEGLLPSKTDLRNKELNYFPSEFLKDVNEFNTDNSTLFPAIDLTILPGHYYLLEKSISIFKGKINDSDKLMTFTLRYNFPKENFPKHAAIFEKGPHYYIPLLFHISNFNTLISRDF